MSDFTKEELDYIEELLSEYYEYFEGEEDEVWELHDKVKSMIDNYCEHNECPSSHSYTEKLVCDDCGLIEDKE